MIKGNPGRPGNIIYKNETLGPPPKGPQGDRGGTGVPGIPGK
jgi:hypothetical protein